MKIIISIYLDGETFNAEAFSGAQEFSLSGSVASQKRIKDGEVEVFGNNWQSDLHEVEVLKLDEGLYLLMSQYKNSLLNAAKYGGTRIIVSVVVEYKNSNEVGGYFFSTKTIQLLSELGANLDIDVVHSLD